jgi:anhydro-N-acetylmuramic acid kinase|tara:strand:- start:1423 stop:2589 length:1167 start_codon:yes stop_codon:yes gene_type:complete
MGKIYTALGLMSGTSMDGVDASIIQTDGKSEYKAILDKYFEYPKNIYKNLTTLRDKIKSSKDLKKQQKQIKSVEKEITIFHAKAANEILKKTKVNVNFIGFHGQTIFHNADEKITKQLGDGKLLSILTRKTVVYDFRQNDIKNNGQGAPLTPIFHKLLVEQNKIKTPVIILNIGGITNYTFVKKDIIPSNHSRGNWKNKKKTKQFVFFSGDTGPGNCLIDLWMREHSAMLYDKNGKIALSGKINKEIVRKALTWTDNKHSYDIKDFNYIFLFFKKLSLKDGAASLAEYTAETILHYLDFIFKNNTWNKNLHFLISGGGRKNNFLVNKIKNKIKKSVKLIDNLEIDGDFIESQAFAYLAIRSYLKLPISFPETTGCKKPCTGGVMIKNF